MSRLAPLLLAAALAGCGADGAQETAADAPPPEPRSTMHEIFDAMTALLPLALHERRFADPTRRSSVQSRLDALAAAADRLEAHGAARDASFAFLSRSLADDLEEAQRRFLRGQPEEARFYLISATQSCVTCHARVPAAREFPLAERLTEQVEMAALPPRERAHFLVVTRRFEEALATWETFFRDPETTAADLDAAGTLFDYLAVALRVERDPDRARRTLVALAEREGLRDYLRDLVSQWVEDLRELRDEATAPPSLAVARRLVEEAESTEGSPAGPQRAIHHLVASAHLHGVIDRGEAAPAERAWTFYLLGLVEAQTVDSFWVPQAEFHLETAIRTAPGSEAARRAYALLEEYVAAGWGGSGGPHLPADVRARLDRLRALLEEAEAGS